MPLRHVVDGDSTRDAIEPQDPGFVMQGAVGNCDGGTNGWIYYNTGKGIKILIPPGGKEVDKVLRLKQRNDGLGLQGHARIMTAGKSTEDLVKRTPRIISRNGGPDSGNPNA